MVLFKEQLRILRLTKNLTQDELAAALGLAKSTISMYENGNREPDFETLEAIADYFNVDMNTLLGCNSVSVGWDDVAPRRFERIQQKLSQVGIAIRRDEGEGYLWLDYSDGTLEITLADLLRLDERATRDLKSMMEDFKDEHIDDFCPFKKEILMKVTETTPKYGTIKNNISKLLEQLSKESEDRVYNIIIESFDKNIKQPVSGIDWTSLFNQFPPDKILLAIKDGCRDTGSIARYFSLPEEIILLLLKCYISNGQLNEQMVNAVLL